MHMNFYLMQDLMVKNIKRHQRLVKRDGGDPEMYNIIPTTFALPQDYALFVEVGIIIVITLHDIVNLLSFIFLEDICPNSILLRPVSSQFLHLLCKPHHHASP